MSNKFELPEINLVDDGSSPPCGACSLMKDRAKADVAYLIGMVEGQMVRNGEELAHTLCAHHRKMLTNAMQMIREKVMALQAKEKEKKR